MNKSTPILLIVLFTLFFYCTDESQEKTEYIFVEKYCTTITVGGVVGIQEKCYEVGDVVLAEFESNTAITVRIAKGPQINDASGPWSFQELLEIPLVYLKKQ